MVVTLGAAVTTSIRAGVSRSTGVRASTAESTADAEATAKPVLAKTRVEFDSGFPNVRALIRIADSGGILI
jgi:hypothetical protein